MNVRNKLIECLESIGVFIESTVEDVCINEYGVDSVMMISLIIKIEETFSVVVPDQYLNFEILSSFNGLVCLLESLLIENK